MTLNTNLISRGDCYTVLKRNFPEDCIDLIYLDPPFSFDPKYAKLWYDKETLEMFEEMRKGDVKHYTSWMSKRLEQCHRTLKNTGSIYLHCDWKFGHYLKVQMDNIFGRNNFQNEIIWHYTTGGVSQIRWGRKHDTILFYSKTNNFHFIPQRTGDPNDYRTLGMKFDEDGRPYKMKSGERLYFSEEGPILDDVWDIPFLSTVSKERLGYSTQKPETLLERIIKSSSNPKDTVLDPMCGCGTTIVVAHKLERQWVGIDISSQSCEIMKKRMERLEGITNVEVRGLPLTINDLNNLTPSEFEIHICDMTNSVKTTYVGDKGIDGYHLGETPLQIKQQKSVGRNVVDNFETALRRKNKDKGYIIAFSFTKGAYEEIARAKDDGLNIKLISVEELIIRDYDLEELLEQNSA